MPEDQTNDELLTAFDDGVLTLTLNRPAALNALTWPMLRQLPNVLREAARDLAVRVVVLRGAGRAFCAGGDLKGFVGGIDEGDPVAVRHRDNPDWHGLMEARLDRQLQMIDGPKLLHTMGKPTIAMVRGPVAGAGMSYAMACDFRVASDTTLLTSAFAKVGTSGDLGGSYFVTKLVGPSQARQLYFFSDKLDAEACLAKGLVDQVVPDADLEHATMALARRLAEGPPLAYRNIKENINAAEWMGMHETLAIEARNMVRTSLSDDSQEGRLAFQERRAPRFVGR